MLTEIVLTVMISLVSNTLSIIHENQKTLMSLLSNIIN